MKCKCCKSAKAERKTAGLIERWLGCASARLAGLALVRADRRGDNQAVNALVLSIWANQSDEVLPVHQLSHDDLVEALIENRLSIQIEPQK